MILFYRQTTQKILTLFFNSNRLLMNVGMLYASIISIDKLMRGVKWYKG